MPSSRILPAALAAVIVLPTTAASTGKRIAPFLAPGEWLLGAAVAQAAGSGVQVLVHAVGGVAGGTPTADPTARRCAPRQPPEPPTGSDPVGQVRRA